MKIDNIMYILLDKKSYAVDKNNNKVLLSNKEIKNMPDYFKQVHKNCIVNTKHIIEYNWAKSYFILDNNEKISLLSKKFIEI